MSALPATNPHRNVDVYLIDRSASFKLVIVAPTLIYGKGIGPEGIANTRSIQIPLVIKAAAAGGASAQVGEGKNIWSNVHIEDVVDLYALIFDGLLENKITTLGASGYFLPENGEQAWGDIIKRVAELLVAKKVIQSSEVISARNKEELTKIFGDHALAAQLGIGGNSRSTSTKSRKLGWKPKHNNMLDTLEEEVDVVLKAFNKSQ